MTLVVITRIITKTAEQLLNEVQAIICVVKLMLYSIEELPPGWEIDQVVHFKNQIMVYWLHSSQLRVYRGVER